MKKILSLFLSMLLLTSQCIAIAENEDNEEWFASDDGVLNARIQSVDTTSYSDITLTTAIDNNEIADSSTSTWHWDLSALISEFAASNPSYGNRRIPITIKEISSFEYLRGTTYRLLIDYTIGRNDEFSGRLAISSFDLADFWPEEYVNYDLMQAISYLKEIKKGMYNPSSLVLREARLYFNPSNPDVLFYYFDISGQVKAGGTSKEICIAYQMNIQTDGSTNYVICNVTTDDVIATHSDSEGAVNIMVKTLNTMYVYNFRTFDSYSFNISDIINGL